jgi:hypothetical protein
MAKPKRINVYSEASLLAEQWHMGQRQSVLEAVTRPGPTRTVLPALVFHRLQKDYALDVASKFLRAVVDRVVRD